MSTFALFCTTPVKTEIINDLLKQAADNNHEGENVLTLITNKDQKTFDMPTKFPVPPFESDFMGTDTDTLGEYCKTKFAEMAKSISPFNFAVLDERGIKESSVLLVSWSAWSDENGPELVHGYKSVRVRFSAVGILLLGLTVNFYLDELDEDDFDGDGVYSWVPGKAELA